MNSILHVDFIILDLKFFKILFDILKAGTVLIIAEQLSFQFDFFSRRFLEIIFLIMKIWFWVFSKRNGDRCVKTVDYVVIRCSSCSRGMIIVKGCFWKKLIAWGLEKSTIWELVISKHFGYLMVFEFALDNLISNNKILRNQF